ncbi:MAG: TraB/GumN family protein [Ferruginibacter sp.]
MKFCILAAAMVIMASCKAQPELKTNPDHNSLLWEISGNHLSKPSYLFGTFHLICKNDIPAGSQLQEAVKASGEMYMELDLDDPATMMGGLMLMRMRGDTTLKTLYTEAEYKKVADFFKDSLQMPLAMLNSTKPFFLSAMLYPKMLPCKTMTGVEEELMKMAKAHHKEIRGLETMAFQAAVFDSIPYTVQAKELLHSIDSLAEYRRLFDTMVQAYRSQQLNKIEEQFSKTEFGMEENQDILLDNRNRNWVGQLKKIMKAGPVFIAVGAGHLVGEQGLIALLKKEGYTLRPLLNK